MAGPRITTSFSSGQQNDGQRCHVWPCKCGLFGPDASAARRLQQGRTVPKSCFMLSSMWCYQIFLSSFQVIFLGAGPLARTLFIWVQKLKWNSAVCGAARAQRQATNRVASLHLSVGLGNQQMENSDCLLVDDVDFAVKVSNTNEPAEWPAADGRGTHSCPAVRHFRDRLRCQRIHLPDNIYTSHLRS